MTFKRSSCPIANALDILGDKWTLLVVRDLALGKTRYQEFLSSPEHIASNILAERLKQLEASGIVARQAYQQNPVRYEYALTEKGKGLKPVLFSLIAWGQKHFPGAAVFPRVKRQGRVAGS